MFQEKCPLVNSAKAFKCLNDKRLMSNGNGRQGKLT